MAAKKNNNRGTTANKDFKYYTRTFWKIFLLGMGGILLFFLFGKPRF